MKRTLTRQEVNRLRYYAREYEVALATEDRNRVIQYRGLMNEILPRASTKVLAAINAGKPADSAFPVV